MAWEQDGWNSARVLTGYQRAFASAHGLKALERRFLSVRIEGLEPGEQVFYRVVAVPIRFHSAYEIERGEEVASAVYSFCVVDAKAKSATFAVINDTHERLNVLQPIMKKLADDPAEILVWNGDVFDDVRNEDQIVANVLNPAGVAYAATRPVLFTSGNHDVRGAEARLLERAFTPWSREEPLGKCFALRQGPVALIGLDTGEDKPDVRPVFAGLADFEQYREDQRDWLKAILSRPEIETAPYIVVFCHIPLNGLPGQNGGDTEEDFARWHKRSRELWGPLLEAARVQLVVSGHTHEFRYDAPSNDRTWGQLVGGAPYPKYATIIRGQADAEQLKVTMYRLNGLLIKEWQFAPRKL
jgi:3',5'-cyclic AMP phosphodiesterase CpdA